LTFRDRCEEALLAHLKAKTGRCRARAQADVCRAAAGDQSHGGAAPQHRRG
jgi:hypothetical protein